MLFRIAPDCGLPLFFFAICFYICLNLLHLDPVTLVASPFPVCHLPLLLALALAKTITLTFSFDLPQFSSPYIAMHCRVIKCTFPPKMSTGFTVAVFIF